MSLHPQTRAALAAQPGEPLTRDNIEAVRASMRNAIGVEVGRPGVMVPVVEDRVADGVPAGCTTRATGTAPRWRSTCTAAAG